MHVNGREKPDPLIFSYKFQGIFNCYSSVFGALTEHTKIKIN